MSVLTLLSSLRYTKLGEYHVNTSSGKDAEHLFSYFSNDAVKQSLEQFQKELASIDKNIKHREPDLKGYSYKYLRPSKIPQGINI